MERLDVLFVIPTNVPDIACGRIKDAIEPPAKARFMAAYLMRRNCSMDLFDSNLTDSTPEKMAEEVATANPHLVVVPVYGFNPSASTQTMVSARLFAQAIKNICPNIPILFSGTHPAAIPVKTLMDEPVDYVCSGEGPITVHEMIQALKAGGSPEDIRRVRSLWYWTGGGTDNRYIVRNNPAPLIDLNLEPAQIGWKYMDPKKYIAHHWQSFYQVLDQRMPYANPYSREGCPFHCGFCNIQATYRDGEEYLIKLGQLKPGVNSFRTLKPELFVEEVTYLVETYGVKTFKIPDEMFWLDSHWEKIFKMLAERFSDSLNFWSYARIDTCRPQDMEIYRAGGGRWVSFGIEAADSKIRSGQDKKFKDTFIYDQIRAMHAAGIEGALNYIFGLENDTFESMEKTFRMACDLNGAYGNFYCAQALPGANSLYGDAKKLGYPLPERPGGPGWAGHAQYSYESEPCYLGTALTQAQILKFRDEKHIAYYKRPEYRERLLKDPKFGETALKNIDEWLLALTPDKLKRRIIKETKQGSLFAPQNP